MSEEKTPPKFSIYWFRKALRLHDNDSLLEACKSKNFLPIFIFDPIFTCVHHDKNN